MPIACIEAAENRTLFANLTGLGLEINANRTLRITGTPAADHIVVRGYDGYVTVKSPAGEQSIAWTRFKRIQIDASDGSDRVTLTGVLTRGVAVFGGSGNDRLINDASEIVPIPPTLNQSLALTQPGLRPAGTLTLSGTTWTGSTVTIRTTADRPAFAFYGGRGNDLIAEPRRASGERAGDTVDGGAGVDRVVLNHLENAGIGKVINLGQPKYDWAVLSAPLQLGGTSIEWVTIPHATMITRRGVFKAVLVSASQSQDLTLPIVDQAPAVV